VDVENAMQNCPSLKKFTDEKFKEEKLEKKRRRYF
jgi:hypothetical protein